MSGNRQIPHGWTNFTKMGQQLPGTPFVPFKVPLKQTVLQHRLPADQWFTPKDVLEKLPRLKLIINLTKATNGRYYSFKDFEDQGVAVLLIMCEGRGTLPPADKLIRFYEAVDDFLGRAEGSNSDGLIGVHCTHGLNRTGYFICKYLVEKMNMAPDAAIELFETARGHHIERESYTHDLRASCAWRGRSDDEPSSRSTSNHSMSSSYGRHRDGRSDYRNVPRHKDRAQESVADWRQRDYHENPSNARFFKPRQHPRRDDDRRDNNQYDRDDSKRGYPHRSYENGSKR